MGWPRMTHNLEDLKVSCISWHTLLQIQGLGRSSNNKIDLVALKFVLLVAVEKGVQKFQIMGDSMLVIDWLVGGLLLLKFFF